MASRTMWWIVVAVIATLVGCGDDGPTQTPNVRIWAPSHVAVGALVALDFGDHLATADVRAEVIEPELEYDAIEPTVRDAIANGTVDADLLALPWAIAQRLAAEGLVETSVQLLSHDDPEQEWHLLPIVLARPAPPGRRFTPPPVTPPLAFENGCLTDASRQQLVSRLALPADAAVVDGAIEATARELVKLFADKAVEDLQETIVKTIVREIIDEQARRLGEQGFLPHTARRALALKALGAAFKAVSAVMDYKAFLELMYNSVDVNDATKTAYESAVMTFADASGLISDLVHEMFMLELGVVSCDVSGKDALERLDEIEMRVAAYERQARMAISEMANIQGEISPHMAESLDNAMSRYLKKWRELHMAAQAKADSVADGNAILAGLIADDPETDDLDWETFAALLTGQSVGNVFVHSNGVLTTTSEGHTDIIRSGGGILDMSEESTQHLFGPAGVFACGTTSAATTVCGDLDMPPGRAVMVAVDVADELPFVDAEYHYQYGAVFDGDNNAANNYRGSASYPKDLFDNTDAWYELRYAPNGDWSLHATLARDGAFSSRQTGARAIMHAHGIVYLIPEGEFDFAIPLFRVSAFRHRGDYGLNPPHDFNGDVYPTVDNPLDQLAPDAFIGGAI